MGSQVYSAVFLAVLVIAAWFCVRRPFLGLLVLVALSPFYAILREASTGSPVFFVWPYVLTGILMLGIAFREGVAFGEERGMTRAPMKLAFTGAVTILALATALETSSGALRAMVSDTSLSSMGRVLSGPAFVVATAFIALFGAMFLALFFRAMRRREARTNPLDVIVAAFLVYGALEVLNAWLRSGLLFTGLNGLRYYFIGATVYFPARYLLTDRQRSRRFLTVVAFACLAGAAELLLENYLLNVRGIQPGQLPWVGHLFEQFEYAPDPTRAFYEGRYFPLGFMYFAHVSGLFLLLGLAICVTRSLAARDWREAAPYLLLSGLLVTGAVWTSRTVILLMVATYVFGALLVQASWRRRVGGLGALISFMFIAAGFLIPGVRYNLAGEIAFLSSRAIPNLINAAVVDLKQIAGVAPPAAAPFGWRLVNDIGATAVSGEHTRSSATSLAVIADGRAAEYRDIVTVTPALSGRRVRAEAWLKAFPGTQASLQIHSGNRVGTSAMHPARGDWKLLVAYLDAAPKSGDLGVDIDVAANGRVFVDQVRLVPEGGGSATQPITLLGDPPTPVPAATPTPAIAPPAWYLVLFGRGAQFGDWNLVFFGKARSDSFATATYSDTKYLEFAEQFGLVGLAILVMLAGMATWRGVQLTWRENDTRGRADAAAVTVMMVVTFVSLIHLPSLFLIGYSTSAYVALAVLAAGHLGPVRARASDRRSEPGDGSPQPVAAAVSEHRT